MRLTVFSLLLVLFFTSCVVPGNKNNDRNTGKTDFPEADSFSMDTAALVRDTSETRSSDLWEEQDNKAGEALSKGNQQSGKLDNSPEQRNTVEYHFKRGLVLFTIKNYADGIREFDTVIRMSPDMVNAYVNRGKGKMEMKLYHEAVPDFEKAIQIENNDTTAYLNLGLSYFYLGDFKKSIEANTKLLKISKTNPRVYFNRGVSYGQLNDYANAIRDFDDAIRLDPGYHEALFNRGLAYYFSGNKASACSDWEKALRIGSEKAARVFEKYCK